MFTQLRALTKARNNLQKALTDLKEAQDQLVMSEKLASLGKVTAGIAHELKNPLNFINNFSKLNYDLLDELHEPMSEEEHKAVIKLLEENTSKIKEHGMRADAIITNMIRHLDNAKSKPEDFDVSQMVEETIYYSIEQNKKRFPSLMIEPQKELLFNATIYKPTKDIARAVANICDNALYALNDKLQHDKDFKAELVVKSYEKKQPCIYYNN